MDQIKSAPLQPLDKRDAEEMIDPIWESALRFMERTGDQEQARRTLLRLGLTHHLAFDYHAANEAFGDAFAIPAPPPVRLEPSEEQLRFPTSRNNDALTSGHSGFVREKMALRTLVRNKWFEVEWPSGEMRIKLGERAKALREGGAARRR